MSAIRISEAATLLGVSDDTVRRWIAAGELPATSGEGVT
ncbi:MAG TPA: excisionase family DNA-binding protein, partial [Gordonia sp. (in: high G+C Gram-positive bacteria)]|nr:excisionase family DNA-binding protein [Gordonia sp. (in: high G+C Gram-positive bacteria)]